MALRGGPTFWAGGVVRKGSARRSIAQSSRGFTLIEVLVVVGVIALLVAILLPALWRVKMRARVVAVHSDLRQITIALDAYAMNHRDKLPPTRFACGTSVNYQLPVELASTRYLPRGASAIPQADFRDAFNPEHTYKYVAPGPIYLNGVLFDFPNSTWRPRAKIWVPDDFPRSEGTEGRFYYNRHGEPPSPVTYAVWSVGSDPDSPKFPRDEESGVVDETKFPVPKAFWMMNAGDTGVITHIRARKGFIYMSP